ncbi:MAG: glycosyltransferase [Alphaproteobacteria bacterium]|nr:glycosyltransferase [Alphaproteobacteria bacterium]
MRVVLLDPGLQTAIGHHYNLDLGLVGELRRLGVPYRLFVNQRVTPELAVRLGAEPSFIFHPYARSSEDRLIRDFEDYLDLNEQAFADLKTLSGAVDLSDSLVIVHTTTNRMLLGLARWLASGLFPASSRLALVLPHVSGLSEGEPLSWDAAFYRHAFNRLRPHLGQVLLLTLSDLQAHEFGALSEAPVEVMPYPNPASGWLRDRVQTKRPPRSKHRILFCGEATLRKGFHLLADIIRAVGGARGDVEFAVQLNGWRSDAERVAEFQKFARARYDTKTIAGFIGEDDYYRVIEDADAVLLPYQSMVYRSGTSAVFEEAVYLGRPVIVPPETMMAAQLAPHPYAGIVAGGHDAAAFARSILALAGDYPRIAEGARRAGEVWRARDGMDRFVSFLLARASPQ